MKITPATFPPHIARAYGVRASQPAARVTPNEPADRVGPIAKITPARRNDLAGLVARVVPGSISFTDDGTAMPKAPSLPMYTRSADRNAAATGIAVGRSIDVTG